MPVRRFLPTSWWTAGTRGVEALSACTAIWWGVVLALPWDSFAVSLSFDNLRLMASEEVWAVVYGGIGLFQLAALFLDRYELRFAATALAASLWCTTAISMILKMPQSTTPGVYTFLALGCLWVLIRSPSRHTVP